MDFNLKCENFKQKVMTLINQSDLPISMIYYMFQSLYKDIEATYINAIYQQKKKEEAKQQENKNQD